MRIVRLRTLDSVRTRRKKLLMMAGRKKGNLLERYRESRRDNELDFTAGVSDEQVSERLTEGLKLLEKQKALKGLPISKFDIKTGKAYLKFPDGRVEYVD